jgi:hypothetical protein
MTVVPAPVTHNKWAIGWALFVILLAIIVGIVL